MNRLRFTLLTVIFGGLALIGLSNLRTNDEIDLGGGELEAQGLSGISFQCVAPSSTSPSGGYCSVGATYPLPVTIDGTSGINIGVNDHASNGDNLTATAGALNVYVAGSGLANQSVNLTQVGGSAISLGQALAAASIPVVLPAAGTVVTQATGSNLHAQLDSGSTTAVTQATGSNLHAQLDSGSTTAATQATGTNLHTVTDSTSVTQNIPGTTGGLSISTVTAANSTNATNLKNAAGMLYHISGYSAAAVPTWITFYNNAGTPTCGTSIVYEALIPVNSTSGGGFVEDIPDGLAFGTGIAYCITTGIGGTGSVAATSIVVNFGYK